MASRSGPAVSVSVLMHLLAGMALVATALLPSSDLPPLTDRVGGVFLLGPAPPPPPPLPLGTRTGAERKRSRRARPKSDAASSPIPDTSDQPTVAEPPAIAPAVAEPAVAEPPSPEPPSPSAAQGSPDGRIGGSEFGAIDGVDGGTPGGIGDAPGGPPWGTGDQVVVYDVPPRPIRQPRPMYPATAALRRIEGTVVVDIWIGPDGKVKKAHVVQSIPTLDDEAVRTVYTWEFEPARRRGVAVPSVLRADVKFRLL